MAADFDTLSEHAQQVLDHAQDEANRHRSPNVTLTDLLVAVVRHADGEALFLALNANAQHLQIFSQREALLKTLNVTTRTSGNIERKTRLPLSDEVRAAIEFARAETTLPDMLSDRIHVEHLLVGIIHAGDPTMVNALKDHRITVERVRSYVSSAAAKAMEAMATGAELRIWGSKEAITRLMRLSGQLNRPMDDLVWEAIERTWFTDRDPATETPPA